MTVRRGVLSLGAGLVALASLLAGPARAGEDLPDDAARFVGIPPIVPDGVPDDAAARRAWSGRLLSWAAAEDSVVETADARLSAAWATLDDDPAEAASALENAGCAYPVGEPYAAVAFYGAARAHLLAKDVAGAETALARAGSAGSRLSPDANDATRARFEIASAWLARNELLPVRVAEAAGRYADVAVRLEAIADDPARRAAVHRDAAWLWHRAARARARAGDDEEASSDADRAVEQATTDRARADYVVWRVYLENHALDAEASPGLLATWPGHRFTESAVAALRGLRGNPNAGDALLALGSSALSAGAYEDALSLYALAFSDPLLVRRAGEDEMLRRGFLVAHLAALALGRYDEAEGLLDRAVALGDLPPEEVDGYRAAIVEAREAARAAEEAAGDEPAPSPEGEATPPASAPARGLLRLPRREAADRPGPGDDPTATAPPAPGAGAHRALLAGGVLALLVLGLGFARGVRARRRGPRGDERVT